MDPKTFKLNAALKQIKYHKTYLLHGAESFLRR
jgi:hypothetical protein